MSEEPAAGAWESDAEPAVWPAPGDDLRASSGVDRDHAFLGWWPGDWGRIIGFRRAAVILAETMLSGINHRDMDTVAFPYLNCWRHYVELQLKYLIGRCQKLLGKPVQRRGGHKIEQLWSELVPLLAAAYPAEEPRDRRVVGGLITQLATLDPDNQEFRYAQRRDGTPTLANVPHLDIVSFHGAMLGMANYLEAIDTAIDYDDELKQQALEYEWEFQQEIWQGYE
jgi:hypothetical protein